MRWPSIVLRELVALFVDDGSVALLTLAWLAIAGLLMPWLIPQGSPRGLLLFLGLAAILAGSTVRSAHRAATARKLDRM